MKLSLSCWRARKKDKRVTREVACRHNVNPDTGAYYKSLVARDELKKIEKIHSKARRVHYEKHPAVVR